MPLQAYEFYEPWGELQFDIMGWHDREWRNPDGTEKSVHQLLNKVLEELGELSAAQTKLDEKRTDKDWHAERVKEMGDVLITLTVVADRMGINPGVALWDRWFGFMGEGGVRDRRSANHR